MSTTFAVTQQTTLPHGGVAIAQYRFCIHNAAGVIQNTSNGGDCDMISLESVTTEDLTAGKTAVAVAFISGGLCAVEAGGTIAKGAAVMSNATGQAITATGTNVVLGRTIEAGTSGNPVTIIPIKKGANFA